MFRFIVWLTPLALVGCALTPPAATVASLAPSQWQAPLPASPDLAHGGSLLQLTQWWQQFNDPVLTEFVIAGQTASATGAGGQTPMAQARLTRTSSKAT
ncbi:MAG: RND transporter, partial [Polaromonas sp.]|nr:RND transporter [Polaromonas sp.]